MTSSTFYPEDIRGKNPVRPSVRIPGYRGIWYALGFKYEYGDKYSGGLGTYTANHQPMAAYASAAHKTFFTYGGTPARDKRELAIMVSYYDHATGQVPQPVILYFDPSVDDPHDNGSLRLDREGHVWIFKSGRGSKRPGIIFRSTEPYSIDAFEWVTDGEFTYPQVQYTAERGFFLIFTKYTFADDRGPARNLFWKTSPDGKIWSKDSPLAGFDGHYQTSGQHGEKIATFFNWHPGSDNDKRTNLYYAQTTDWGQTWTTAAGVKLDLPLSSPKNQALVLDLQSEEKCMYTCDVNFDDHGNPVLLFIVSRKGEPGPAGGPREWTVLHWNNGAWLRHVVTTSDHNYDMGSLYVNGKVWQVIGPTGKAPQAYGTGGEMALWTSQDEGKTWTLEKEITQRSLYNHSYARRPNEASDPFAAFWADGDPRSMTESHLYFTDSQGCHLSKLPYDMTTEFSLPEKIR